MALSRLVASLLLLSSLAIASANYDNYDHQDAQNVDENHNYHHQQLVIPVDELHKKIEKLISHSYPAQHGSEQGYEHPTLPSSQENVKPAVPEGHDYQSNEGINYIEIQGTILCDFGTSLAKGISGAIAKISCPGWNENGYEYAPFSISSVADNHGYYCATYPVSKLPKNDWKQLVKSCQVIPEYSPLGICNLPFLSGGSHGPYLSYSRIVGDKAIYTAGSLFYTPTESSDNYPKESTIPEAHSLPVNGGY